MQRAVGRDKDLVISGGYNVYPKEIEQLTDDLPGAVESAVIGVSHPDLGEGVTAVIVPARDADLNEAKVLASLHDQLARYKQPKRVFFVDSLPRNCSGSMIPDTNVGGNIATINEVSDDEKTTTFYPRVQTGSRLSGA